MAVQSKSQNLEQGDQKGHHSATSLDQTWDTCIHFTDLQSSKVLIAQFQLIREVLKNNLSLLSAFIHCEQTP